MSWDGSRNVMLSQPGSATNLASDSGSADSIKSGRTGNPFTVPFACGPNVTIAEQALAGARTGSYAEVGRMEHDRGGIEANDHSPCPKRHRSIVVALHPDRAA